VLLRDATPILEFQQSMGMKILVQTQLVGSDKVVIRVLLLNLFHDRIASALPSAEEEHAPSRDIDVVHQSHQSQSVGRYVGVICSTALIEVNGIRLKCNATHLIRNLLASRLEREIDECTGRELEHAWARFLIIVMVSLRLIRVVSVYLIANFTWEPEER
jgi:hypothetical protein